MTDDIAQKNISKEVAQSVLKDCVGLTIQDDTETINMTPQSFYLCVQNILMRHGKPDRPASNEGLEALARIQTSLLQAIRTVEQAYQCQTVTATERRLKLDELERLQDDTETIRQALSQTQEVDWDEFKKNVRGKTECVVEHWRLTKFDYSETEFYDLIVNNAKLAVQEQLKHPTSQSVDVETLRKEIMSAAFVTGEPHPENYWDMGQTQGIEIAIDHLKQKGLLK